MYCVGLLNCLSACICKVKAKLQKLFCSGNFSQQVLNQKHEQIVLTFLVLIRLCALYLIVFACWTSNCRVYRTSRQKY